MITKLPYPMGIYTDEAKNTYRVLMLARHHETADEYVIFQPMDGGSHYTLEVAAFQARMSDMVKAPVASAPKLPALPAKSEPSLTGDPHMVFNKEGGEYALDSAVAEYLETDDFEQRLNILAMLRHRITDDMINTMAVATDVVIEEGYIEDRFEALKKALLIRKKYEHKRVV